MNESSKLALEAAEAFCESIYDAYGPIPIPAVARALDAFAQQARDKALDDAALWHDSQRALTAGEQHRSNWHYHAATALRALKSTNGENG